MGLRDRIAAGARAATDRLARLLHAPEKRPLEQGLHRLSDRLGMGQSHPATESLLSTPLRVRPTQQVARTAFYAPAMDGQADPGEVVWFRAPGASGPRALLVVGRNHHTILGLLISPNSAHADDPNWLAIGTGDWDAQGQHCWLRLDRIIEISENGIRRQGAVLPLRRFETVATALRDRYSWS